MTGPTDEIKQRIDIVELIGEYVPLKAAGTNWKGRCPFHNEKTPSFMVSREKAMWHCFGCGRGGDIFSFVQEIDGMDFPEALRLLAKRAGVQLKEYDPKLQTQRTKAIDVLRWVMRYWQEVLLKSAEAEAARAYLHQRAISDDSLEEFQLGFAPAAGDVTYQALKKKGFTDEEIFLAGLTIKRDRGVGYFDRFRGRIMFPIADVHGTIVGCSGRILESILKPGQSVPAKYINSPQTAVYNKSLILYALDKAKQEIKKADAAILVEGYMDCIASYQAGVKNVVAVSGTALTLDQVKLLKRYTQNIILSLDRDAAGAQATLRGVDQALQAAMNVKILRLPFGKDPDELIRKEPAAWTAAIQSAKPIMEYFFDEALVGRDLRNVQDKKAVAKFLLPMIARLGDPIEQTHYLQQLGDLLHLDEETLRRAMPAPVNRQAGTSVPAPAVAPASHAPDRFRAVSERLMATLLRNPASIGQIANQIGPEDLVGDDLRALYKTLVVWYTERHPSTSPAEMDQLISAVDAEQQELLNILLLLGDKEFPNSSDLAAEQDLLAMVSALRKHALARELRELEGEIRRLERAPDPSAPRQLAELLERFQTLTGQLRALS